MLARSNPAQPEITDLIMQHDPKTLARLPVRKADVLEVFSKFGNRKALRAVEALPDHGGNLDNSAIDRILVSTHWEMQRLAEEFYHGHRVWDLLRRVMGAIRASGYCQKLRIIDVGCGIGYTSRWLAAHIPLEHHGMEVVGMDLNSTLICEATRLASLERLNCRFIQGDAFSREHSGHIYLSTGVIHHFREEALKEFLQRHEQPDTFAFLHYDFQPSFLAPFGSWFFHYLRMRTAIAKHDGVLSAVRAHDAKTLTEAAQAVPTFASGIYGKNLENACPACLSHAARYSPPTRTGISWPTGSTRGTPGRTSMTLFVLYVLALLDGLLCGARVSMGRSAVIAKRSYYVRAQLRGLVGAQIVSTIALVALILVAATSSHRIALRSDLEAAATRMLRFFVPYAALVLGNILLRLVPSTDIRSATSVMMLGPLTAIRPLVMIAGVAYKIWHSVLWDTRVLGLFVLALMLGLEFVLNRQAAHRQSRELALLVGS
jgi:SAM-dependent methyltransferase